eukprot:TRINITY_DN9499_c0_g1_i1.p1 TRINITY_DN9499_c0_g1~~TRINITY_DN9499_c0_g1_i1.p1  ORF type:complete len:127 (-),score=24.10 TRINITY_DN9499_c0_g1_i1:28-408(-)
MGRNYHTNCFVCYGCNKPIPTNERVAPKSGNFYCKNCSYKLFPSLQFYPPPKWDPNSTPTTFSCHKCSATVAVGSKFCTGCGSSVPQSNNNQNTNHSTTSSISVCRQCNHQLKPGSKFCTTCGTKQ